MNNSTQITDKELGVFFNILDDEQLRAEYKILYSEYSIDRTKRGSITLRWTVWSLDESEEYMFEAISAAEQIMLEKWAFTLTDTQFGDVTQLIRSDNTDNMFEMISSINEPKTDVFVVRLEDAPDAAISAYNEHYSSIEIGQELSEWFGDDTVNLEKFPAAIQPMLSMSLELSSQWEAEKVKKSSLARQKFDLNNPELVSHLKPGKIHDTRLLSLGIDIVVVFGGISNAGSSGYLKMRKFSADIDLIKAEGRRVFDLQGVFAGMQTWGPLCYGVEIKSEEEAMSMIGKTNIRVGLFVETNGKCTIIDLENQEPST